MVLAYANTIVIPAQAGMTSETAHATAIIRNNQNLM